jgi:cell division inhibitor SepF
MWKKAMDYLGLGPDDAYDDYDIPDEPERPSRSRARDGDVRREGRDRGYADEHTNVRTVPTRQTFPSRDADLTGRRPLPATDDSSVQPRPINAPRQPAPRVQVQTATTDPHTVRPRRFDAAQEIADKFKDGQPVIMNLEASERDVSRRLIDFASGLCYALNGTMEKVATGVYLLKPAATRSSGFDTFGS